MTAEAAAAVTAAAVVGAAVVLTYAGGDVKAEVDVGGQACVVVATAVVVESTVEMTVSRTVTGADAGVAVDPQAAVTKVAARATVIFIRDILILCTSGAAIGPGW